MISDANAAIVGGLVGGLAGGVLGLAGVWIGSHLARRDAEETRHAEKTFALHVQTEHLYNCFVARRKKMLTNEQFYREWNLTMEKIISALLGSGLKQRDKKRILLTVNGKWDDVGTEPAIAKLADELLDKVDSDYAVAAREMLSELGLKREDIDPVILSS